MKLENNCKKIKKLENANKYLKLKNDKYLKIIKTTRSYILKNTIYKLPNEWDFKGDISIVFDLLDISNN